jgi:LacI family transcriptional regulator
MREVAALARVGLKTVSRVINGEPGVSPELRARVQRAIEQLDYLPNLTASSLRRSSGRSATIGLILENVANPFSSALHRAIGDVAWARGVQVFSGSVDEDAIRERLLVSTFAGRASTASSWSPPATITATCSATSRPEPQSCSSIARPSSSTWTPS